MVIVDEAASAKVIGSLHRIITKKLPRRIAMARLVSIIGISPSFIFSQRVSCEDERLATDRKFCSLLENLPPDPYAGYTAAGMIHCGIANESDGTKVTSINTTTMPAYIGSIALTTFSTLILPIEQPTKSAEPTGGVHSPIARFRTA